MSDGEWSDARWPLLRPSDMVRQFPAESRLSEVPENLQNHLKYIIYQYRALEEVFPGQSEISRWRNEFQVITCSSPARLKLNNNSKQLNPIFKFPNDYGPSPLYAMFFSVINNLLWPALQWFQIFVSDRNPISQTINRVTSAYWRKFYIHWQARRYKYDVILVLHWFKRSKL